MKIQDILDNTKTHIAEIGLTDELQNIGSHTIGITQTRLAKSSSCAVIEPLIALVLQGSKAAQYGADRVSFVAGDVIVLGHPLPIISGLIDGTPQEPYIALYVEVDMQIIRGVYNDMGGVPIDDTGPALETGRATADIIDAFGRLLKLRHDPIGEQTLGMAALREVYFRVLRSEQGRALRWIVHADSKANQIAKTIEHIRKEYRSTIRAADLVTISGMSASVFYDTFKRVTSNTPHKFQKDLRLTEAHQLLQQCVTSVSEVAHMVGYESVSQFSRDFSKKFGAPPKTFLGNQAN